MTAVGRKVCNGGYQWRLTTDDSLLVGGGDAVAIEHIGEEKKELRWH
jgi:hypothetical protein